MITACLALLAAQDWPAWRHDAQRSATSPHGLPAGLKLRWTRELPPLEPAWPDQARARFDAAYEPVVADGRVFVGSPRQDSVTAYDVASGRQIWARFTGGPVRFAPFVDRARVYAASDDGHLYCLAADTGELLWKHRGGPSDRLLLGNGRLISTWPARGAPVVADGVVYYAAGIWPFMGIFLRALDAETGKEVWTNDGDGPGWQLQPHRTEAFAGVAPQGCLVVAGDRLLVPGGRSIPAVYDRLAGRLVHYRLADHARRGGSDVSVRGKFYFCAESCFDLETGGFLGEIGRPVLAAEDVWFFPGRTSGLLQAPPQEARIVESKDSKGKITRRQGFAPFSRGAVEVDGTVECLIRAGDVVYAGTKGRVQRVDASSGKSFPSIAVEGTPLSLVAAAGHLLVSTLEGRIHCFGAEAEEDPVVHESGRKEYRVPGISPFPELARSLGVDAGWVVHFAREGVGTRRLLMDLEGGPLRHVFVRPTAEAVDELRINLATLGRGGEEAHVLEGDAATIALPPYFARIIDGATADRASVRRLFDALHPYGGRLAFPEGEVAEEDLRSWISDPPLPGARVETAVGHRLVIREGGVPGGGEWTHEHGDVANTRVSRDKVVQAPLGLLWFGGSSHAGILPRHGHGPQPLVVGGRLFIEGVHLVRAMDIYTGRILWETPLPGVGDFFNNTSHQPGANGSGSNLAAAADGLYVAWGKKAVRLDLATGKIVRDFALPDGAEWGYIGVAGDLLLAGAEPLGWDRAMPKTDPRAGDDDPTASVEALVARILSFRGPYDTRSSSRRLVALDRNSGEVRWTAPARFGWRHNAIAVGGGRVYAVDRLSGLQVADLKKERKEPDGKPALAAFDLATGKELWRTDEDVFATWLSYSAEHDVLVEAGRVASDTMRDEAKGMRARRGLDGRELWSEGKYAGPAMIRGEEILMAGRGCNLLTGRPKLRLHPITGKPAEWTWARTYGCNTPLCSENLILFRSGAAGFFDLAADGGTGNFGGFRSSCTNNLIAAGGIVTSPDYTRTCTCGYQQQTSLALLPMPDAEMWTFFGITDLKGPVVRLGLNLGAPGDRRDGNGTLWLETPSVGGKSPTPPSSVSGEQLRWFRRHASRVGGPLPWVAASGVLGVRTVAVTVDRDAERERRFTVRLVFAEPDGLEPGKRVFDVKIQGKPALEGFDVAREAGGAWRSVVREVRGVLARKEIKIEFAPTTGAPAVLSGVEVVDEDAAPLLLPQEPAPKDCLDGLEGGAGAVPEDPRAEEVPLRPFAWVAGGATLVLIALLAVRALARGPRG